MWTVAASLLWLLGAASASERFGGYAFYVGDPHVHTGVSGDGGSEDLLDCSGSCGRLVDVFEDARANGLDWMVLSEHVNGSPYPASSAGEYMALHAAVLAANDPEGGFVTVPGAEVWFQLPGAVALGHKTLMMFADNEALELLSMSDLQPTATTSIVLRGCDDIDAWMNRLTANFGPALIIPHHPAAMAPMPTNWTCHSEEWEPGVEIYSAHGNSLDELDPFDPLWSGTMPDSTVHHAIDPDGLALRMGFLGGTDGHDTRPGAVCLVDTVMTRHPYGGGLTIVVLDEGRAFDRGAIHDAIVAHRTYATSGPAFPVLVRYGTGGADLGGLGDTLGVPEGQPLDLSVELPPAYGSFVTGIWVVGPDEEWTMNQEGPESWSLSLAPEDRPAWVYVKLSLDGESLYLFRGCDDGGDGQEEWMWLSPSWLEPAEPDLDGDGQTWADGDCDDGDPGVSTRTDEVWYDGVDQDCDGNDDDQDLDGYALGEDCDDRDDGVNPEATDRPGDGVDSDCDGQDRQWDPEPVGGHDGETQGLPEGSHQVDFYVTGDGCSCAVGGGSGLAGLAGLPLVIALLRRRRVRAG